MISNINSTWQVYFQYQCVVSLTCTSREKGFGVSIHCPYACWDEEKTKQISEI